MSLPRNGEMRGGVEMKTDFDRREWQVEVVH